MSLYHMYAYLRYTYIDRNLFRSYKFLLVWVSIWDFWKFWMSVCVCGVEWLNFSVTQEGLHSIYTEVSFRENGCEPHRVETYQMHPFAFGVYCTQIGCILYPVFTISQEQIGINHLVIQASSNSYPRILLATQHDLIFSCNIPCYSVLNFKQKKLNFFWLTIASPCWVFCPKT